MLVVGCSSYYPLLLTLVKYFMNWYSKKKPLLIGGLIVVAIVVSLDFSLGTLGNESVCLAGAFIGLVYLVRMTRSRAFGGEGLQKKSQLKVSRMRAGSGYESILDNQQGMIFSFRKKDDDYMHTLCRGKLARRMGFEPGKVEGRMLHEILSGERFERWCMAYDKAWNGEPVVYEDMTADNGLSYRVYLEPLKQYEQVQEVSAYAVDITDLLRIEDDLEQANQGLSVKNEDLDQLNCQLERSIEHANQLAQEAQVGSHAKTNFLANMSHEIRTPLNALLGMATLLEATSLNDEQRDFVSTINTSCNNLLELVDDILDFSKIEAGFLSLEEIELCPMHSLAEMVDMFGPRIREKKLNFVYEVQENMPERVLGDPARLRQILINLVGNALKFTQQGSLSLKASYVSLGDSFGTLIVSVADTGIGISRKMQEVLEALKLKNYDIILMDVHMPHLNGLEATARIRAELPQDRQPYIIATTASVTPGEQSKYLKEGMDGFLAKPIRFNELVQVLKDVKLIAVV